MFGLGLEGLNFIMQLTYSWGQLCHSNASVATSDARPSLRMRSGAAPRSPQWLYHRSGSGRSALGARRGGAQEHKALGPMVQWDAV